MDPDIYLIVNEIVAQVEGEGRGNDEEQGAGVTEKNAKCIIHERIGAINGNGHCEGEGEMTVQTSNALPGLNLSSDCSDPLSETAIDEEQSQLIMGDMSQEEMGQDSPSGRVSPRISIAFSSGVNLNILKRPQSPSSPTTLSSSLMIGNAQVIEEETSAITAANEDEEDRMIDIDPGSITTGKLNLYEDTQEDYDFDENNRFLGEMVVPVGIERGDEDGTVESITTIPTDERDNPVEMEQGPKRKQSVEIVLVLASDIDERKVKENQVLPLENAPQGSSSSFDTDPSLSLISLSSNLPDDKDKIQTNENTESEMEEQCTPSSSSSSSSSRIYPILPPPHPSKNAKPTRSLLKRRIQENGHILNGECPPPKKRRGIAFDGVTVFYFARTQGFTCVPSQGGSTLGMAPQHMYARKFSIEEWHAEQRRQHKLMLVKIRKQQNEPLNGKSLQSPNSQEDDTAASAITNNGNQQSSDEDDTDDETDVETDSDLEAELDNLYFLQPVPTRQRRLMLREAGVKKIDSWEKDECKDIRTSREFCGCSCKNYCDPDTCSCAQADIKCQVDRMNFPCACTRDGCGNGNGRVEFNPVRVRTHFIQTLMRLELEKKHNGTNQTNCLELDGSGFAPTSSMSIHHANSMNITHPSLSSNHDMIGYPQQCSMQHWDGTGGNNLYYKREDNLNYATNLVRDVPFNTGMELECASIGNYTSFHYNTRTSSPLELDNFALHEPHPSNHSTMQFPPPHEIPPHREESFNLYSTFREDSYSENSDDFSSNGSGGDERQQFPFNSQQPVLGPIPSHQQIVLSDPNRYNNGFFAHHEPASLESVSYPENLLADHHLHPSLSNSSVRQYENSNGTEILHMGNPPLQYQVGNNFPPSFTVSSDMPNGCMYQDKGSNGTNHQFNNSSLPSLSYELVTSEVSCPSSSSIPATITRNGFQPLQHEDQAEENNQDKGISTDGGDGIGGENFGEIIKKSMVETVSA